MTTQAAEKHLGGRTLQVYSSTTSWMARVALNAAWCRVFEAYATAQAVAWDSRQPLRPRKVKAKRAKAPKVVDIEGLEEEAKAPKACMGCQDVEDEEAGDVSVDLCTW